MTVVFESRDIDSSAALLCEHYSAMRISSPGERHRLRMDQVQLSGLRLDRNALDMNVDLEADPLGTLIVARVVSGRASYDDGGGERRYERGDVYVTARPEAGFRAALRGLHVEVAVIDPALLGEVAEPAPGSTDDVHLTDHAPISPTTAGLWWRTYDFVRRCTEASAPGDLNPIYEQEVARLLVAATLAAFPSTARVDPTIEDRHDAHTQTLRRATEFIDAHAGVDITIKEIAEAAGVTIRAVQLSFRRHLDTTPTAYLRGVRLQYIHDELVCNDPYGTTVSEIAGRRV